MNTCNPKPHLLQKFDDSYTQHFLKVNSEPQEAFLGSKEGECAAEEPLSALSNALFPLYSAT